MSAVLTELGLRPFINARATHTRFGGAVMHKSVVSAMAEVAESSLDMTELREVLDHRLSEMTGNEGAFISCGAASGLALAIASCMTGTDVARIQQLPDAAGMKDRVLVQKGGRFDEDICLQIPGTVICEIDSTPEALSAAIDDRTVAMVTTDWEGLMPVGEVVRLCHEQDVPVIVDAAGDVPPIDGFSRYTCDLGADAVVISGGKGLRGPQETGLVLGKKWLTDGCWCNANPNRGIGRTMKVSKQGMVGLYVAVCETIHHHHEEQSRFLASGRYLLDRLGSLPGCSLSTDPPYIQVRWPSLSGFSDEYVMSSLREGDPSILALSRSGVLWLNVTTLLPGEDRLVADRVEQVLTAGSP